MRREYLHDADAQQPNALVVATSAVVTDDLGRVLLHRLLGLGRYLLRLGGRRRPSVRGVRRPRRFARNPGRHVRPVALMLGALSATAALLSACSTGPGPLGNGGDSAQQCVPARQGEIITIGITDLENHSSSPATVQGVSLRASHGLAVTMFWVTPIFNSTLIGTALWPPTGPAWAQRRPAVGAVVPAHTDLNLVFGLARTAKRGTSDGVDVVYSAGGNTYTLAQNTTLVVAPKC